jgi:transposase
MRAALLCPAPAELRVEHVAVEPERITVTARACRAAVPCPGCGHRARRVHAWYVRTLADLPWEGTRVRLVARVRKFVCERAECPRRIFVERLPETAPPHARRTCRAASALEAIGFALGGRAGARLAAALGLAAGRAAILARVTGAAEMAQPTPRVLGVDDWAGRRGRTYGTLLVDLERHAAVDVLPDREAATLAAWLRAHPGVEFVARDRGGAYAEGARLGAPDAIQIADRFHLARNLTQALDRAVGRHHAVVRAVATECGASAPLPMSAVRKRPYTGLPGNRVGPTLPERLGVERRARRLARYEQVTALRATGAPTLAIARELGLDPKTVRAWLAAGSFPERRARSVPQPRVLDPYATYVLQRYDAGLDNARALERELRPLGFRGSYQAVGRYLRFLRRTRPRAAAGTTPPVTSQPPAFTGRETVWLLQTAEGKLSDQERAYLAALTARCPALGQVRELALAFRAMFREHDVNAFRPWLGAARGSELRAFAAGLARDFDAVLAAVVFPWSTGQVEGHVHRLKLVKRSMYGRAGFRLLRARVLRAS